jgi:hypothetical protein
MDAHPGAYCHFNSAGASISRNYFEAAKLLSEMKSFQAKAATSCCGMISTGGSNKCIVS